MSSATLTSRTGPEPRPTPGGGYGPTLQALVLDDEQRYRDYLCRLLERSGLRARSTGCPLEARQLVEQQAIDLLIVDIRLSASIDGLQFADWARQQLRNVALIVITGYGCPEYERRSSELGALAYIEKPFELSLVESHVQRALDRRRLLREVHRLEQELALARDISHDPLLTAEIPAACVAWTGDIPYATPAGQAILDAIADPCLPRPVRRLDKNLLSRLHIAGLNDTGGQAPVFWRDGQVCHCVAHVRPIKSQQDADCVVVFLDDSQSPDHVDDLWVGLLVRAATTSQRTK
ncbi:MAG: response regulator [Phycisphaerae bacterium]|jgi:CheY-like chemotaxis protein